MPILTISVSGLPVAPLIEPSRMPVAKAATLARTASTSGITSSPCTFTGLPEKLRSAVCSAGRCSVGLTISPANMRSRLVSTSAVRARVISAAITRSSTRCFE